MNEVTRIINAIEKGESRATEKLLPLVYEELRILAAKKMAQEKPGHTLQATALVHEAYLRLVGEDQSWNSRNHFFKAAAEAMRRESGSKSEQKLFSGRHINEAVIISKGRNINSVFLCIVCNYSFRFASSEEENRW